RGEAGEIELPGLGLLRRVEVLEALAALERDQRLLRLLPGQLDALLRAQLLLRDLVADLAERLHPLRLLLLRLEEVEPGAVLEDCGELPRLELRGLVLERLAVRRRTARDEAQVAAAVLGRVLALLLRHRGEVLARLHFGERRLDARAGRLLLLGGGAGRYPHRDHSYLHGGRLGPPGLRVLLVRGFEFPGMRLGVLLGLGIGRLRLFGS